MLLAVNANNTRTSLGLLDGTELVQTWSLATRAERTADELASLYASAMALHGFSFRSDVTGVAVSSVVPAVTRELRLMTQRYYDFEPVVVEPGIRTGIPILIDNPKEMGADRIANAAAVAASCGGPAVVVDMGTATTFDAISARHELLGCAIAPGLTTSANALTSAAAMLKRVELTSPRHLIGKSTVDAVQSGVVYGYACLVRGMVERFRAELGEGTKTILTGGDADKVMEHLTGVDVHDPWLVLRGLRVLYERNTT